MTYNVFGGMLTLLNQSVLISIFSFHADTYTQSDTQREENNTCCVQHS